ncbi:MAG: hypothetical protein WEA11_04460 [Acidimicrobiales bacterium]
MDNSALDAVLSMVVDAHTIKGSSIVVGVAGGVAVGKSTFSKHFALFLTEKTGLAVGVVATDGFLYSNAALFTLGLSDRKGFPESYDNDAIKDFIARVQSGKPTSVPVYDHHTYDVTGKTQIISPVDIMLLEGVNTLQFHEHLDLGVYLQAEEPLMRSWFVTRTSEFREAARSNYSPFFDPWLDVSNELFFEMVTAAWESVNLPNLIDHIEPSKQFADAIVEWEADHKVRSVRMRESS